MKSRREREREEARKAEGRRRRSSGVGEERKDGEILESMQQLRNRVASWTKTSLYLTAER
jgi:hypothetical protein